MTRRAGVCTNARRPESRGLKSGWSRCHGRKSGSQRRQLSPQVCGQSSQRVVNPPTVGSQWPNATVRSLSAVWPSHASCLAPTRPKLCGRGVVPCDGSHGGPTLSRRVQRPGRVGRQEGSRGQPHRRGRPQGRLWGALHPPARPGLSKSPRMHLVKRSCPASSRHRPGRTSHPPAAMRGASVIARRPPHGAADLPPPRRVGGMGGFQSRA